MILSSNSRSKERLIGFLLSFFFPLVMFLASIRNYKAKNSLFLSKLSLSLIGATIIVGGLSGTTDSKRYIDYLNSFVAGQTTLISELSNFGVNKKDLNKILLTFFVSLISESPIVFFFIVSLVLLISL